MAVTLEAQALIQTFVGKQEKAGFLSSHFIPKPRSTGTTANSIVWDIKRWANEVAGTIDRCAGTYVNANTGFTTKELTPPNFGESLPLDVCDVINRIAGETSWNAASRSHRSRMIDLMTDGVQQIVNKVDLAMELMSAQVLTTGQISMSGSKPYVEDFFPKSSHFPTAPILWSLPATALPLLDIENLGNQIRVDSKKRITKVYMGRQAVREMFATDQWIESANFRRIDSMEIIRPRVDNRGAVRMGRFTAGCYDLELWCYELGYEPFGGGTETPFIPVDKVICLPDDPGFVLGSVVVPHVLPPDPRVSFLRTPPMKSELGYDITPNVWCNDEGTVVSASVRARPVPIPQGIDEFGCLST